MCIAIISTAHPEYPLILINNRDEYLSRPTALANYWDPPNGHVLGGRDLQRDVQGTWLGVTTDGRVAVLTNFHEEDPNASQGLNSRGAMVKAYLTPDVKDVPSTQSFMEHLIAGTAARGTGGFSLVCGKIGEDLAVVSNRTKGLEEIKWIKREGETVALSNAAFTDKSWPKVTQGEKLMGDFIRTSIDNGYGKDDLINGLFSLLDTSDVLDPQEPPATMREWTRRRIFYSAFHLNAETRQGGKVPENSEAKASPNEVEAEDLYGTMKQTVLLVDASGTGTYIERSWKPQISHDHLSSRLEHTQKYKFKLLGGLRK